MLKVTALLTCGPWACQGKGFHLARPKGMSTCFDSSISRKYNRRYYVRIGEIGGFANSGRTQLLCNAEFQYDAEDDAIYVVATEDIGPNTEILVYYKQSAFWAQVDFEKKQARAKMSQDQLVIARTADNVSKAATKAVAVVKAANKKIAVAAAMARRAAAKAAAKVAARAAANAAQLEEAV